MHMKIKGPEITECMVGKMERQNNKSQASLKFGLSDALLSSPPPSPSVRGPSPLLSPYLSPLNIPLHLQSAEAEITSFCEFETLGTNKQTNR